MNTQAHRKVLARIGRRLACASIMVRVGKFRAVEFSRSGSSVTFIAFRKNGGGPTGWLKNGTRKLRARSVLQVLELCGAKITERNVRALTLVLELLK